MTGAWIVVAASGAVLVLAVFYCKIVAANQVRDSRDVQSKLGVRCLGNLPLMARRKRHQLRSSLVYLQTNELRFNEAIRTVRTRIVLALLGRSDKTVVVVTGVAGAGCTTLAANLAISLGQLERVLLVEADRDGAAVAVDFAIPMHTPGLLNLLAANATLQQCVHRHEASGIDVLPVGTLASMSEAEFAVVDFAAAIATLAEHYDRVVIDAGADRAMRGFAAHANVLIYVLSAGPTPLRQVRADLQQLSESVTPLLGVVVNRTRRGASEEAH